MRGLVAAEFRHPIALGGHVASDFRSPDAIGGRVASDFRSPDAIGGHVAADIFAWRRLNSVAVKDDEEAEEERGEGQRDGRGGG